MFQAIRENNNKRTISKTMKTSRVLIALLTINSPVCLSDTALIDEQDIFADITIKSATRLAQSPRDLPISVTVIDRDMIDASGATDIPELFRLVAGFRVAYVAGSRFSVSGHSPADEFSRKLEVLVDGRRVQSAVINIVDWSALAIDIDDIDSIEVMRGTSAAVYGANAFDGAVNIITRKPFEDKGHYIRGLSGESGVKNIFYKYGFETISSEHSIKVSERYSEGFDDAYDNSRYTKIRYRGDFSPGPYDEVDVQFGFTRGYADEEGDNIVELQRPRDTEIFEQYYRWRHTYDKGDDFVLKAYHNRVKYDDTYQTANISEIFSISPSSVPTFFGGRQDQPFEFAYYTGVSDRFGLDAQRTFSYQSLKLVTGFDLFYDEIKSKYLFRDDGVSRDLNKQAFGNMEWQFNKSFTFNATLLIESSSNTKPTYSPRTSINHHFNKNNTFRLSAAQSFRSRSAYGKDLFLASAYTSDNTLFDVIVDYRNYKKPEKNTSIEFAHLLDLQEKGISMEWKVYHDRYSDVRVNVRDNNYVDGLGDGAIITINSGEFYVEGAEVQLKYTADNEGFVSVQYSYANPGGKIIGRITPAVRYEILDNDVPKHSFSVLMSKKIINDWNISMLYSSLSETEWHSAGDELPRYKRLDARLAKDFLYRMGNVRTEIIAHNLLEKYIEFKDENVFERRIMARISVNYK